VGHKTKEAKAGAEGFLSTVDEAICSAFLWAWLIGCNVLADIVKVAEALGGFVPLPVAFYAEAWEAC